MESSEYKKSANEDQKCSLSRRYDGVSCSTIKELQDMANAWNIYIKKHKINKEPIEVQGTTKRSLVESLLGRLKNVCSDQLCMVGQDFIEYTQDKHNIKKKTYLPAAPKGQFEWLSTSHINEYIDQLQDVFVNYKFLGAVPIDFDEINIGIRNLNFDKLFKSGKTQIGIIFNTDTSKGRGQHWISLFADLNNKKIYFFDSTGNAPPKEVKAFMDRIANWIMTHYKIDKKKIDIRWSKMEHQKKNSECGMYCIHWQTAMLQGRSFDDYNKKRITDDEVNRFRKKYFTLR